MDLTGTQIKNTYGNVLTIGTTAGSPQTGTLQNGEGLNITSATLTGGTVTTSNPLLDMTQTWNDAGVTFTSLKLNVTDTASDSDSLLLDLQVGGSSKFSVKKSAIASFESWGLKLQGNNYGVGSIGTKTYLYANGNPKWVISHTGEARTVSGGSIGFSSSPTDATAGEDTALVRDAAGVLAQRNSTNAQTFNIYNTYTDGSNYERGFLKWDSNVLEIGTEALGTGTNRNMKVFFGASQLLVLAGSAIEINKPLRTNSNYIEFTEMTAPSAPSTNVVRIYAEDNGSGKTKLMAIFPSGAAQQIAIEP